MLCVVCLQAFPSHGPIPRTAPEDAPFDGFTYPNDPASSVNSYYHENQLIPHHPSFLSLKASVELNCLICSAFWNQQSPSVARWLDFEMSSLAPGGDAHSLQTTMNPAIEVIQPGTQLGIHTSIDKSESTARQTYHTEHEVIVPGYPVYEGSDRKQFTPGPASLWYRKVKDICFSPGSPYLTSQKLTIFQSLRNC